MASMDADKARYDLEQARRSYHASARLAPPPWVAPVSGLLIAGAIALGGLAPAAAWLRLVTIAAGVLLAVAAVLVALVPRSRRGIRGVRGPARDSWISILVSGIAFFISMTGAAPQTRWVYTGLGVVVGLVTWVALRKDRP